MYSGVGETMNRSGSETVTIGLARYINILAWFLGRNFIFLKFFVSIPERDLDTKKQCQIWKFVLKARNHARLLKSTFLV